MKNLKNLTGAKELSNKEQKNLLGGKMQCRDTVPYCPVGWVCTGSICERPLYDID